MDKYIEKTDAFCANTSIVYEGEQIAIWMVQEDLDESVLTSKIVHEMFHGYQSIISTMEKEHMSNMINQHFNGISL